MRGVAFSSIPMNRLNQTESAVSILVCLLKFRRIRFRIMDILTCLNVSGEDFLN